MFDLDLDLDLDLDVRDILDRPDSDWGCPYRALPVERTWEDDFSLADLEGY